MPNNDMGGPVCVGALGMNVASKWERYRQRVIVFGIIVASVIIALVSLYSVPFILNSDCPFETCGAQYGTLMFDLPSASERAHPKIWKAVLRMSFAIFKDSTTADHLGALYKSERNGRRAVDFYQWSARRGDPPAYYAMGRLYSIGGYYGLTTDALKAADYYRQAGEKLDSGVGSRFAGLIYEAAGQEYLSAGQPQEAKLVFAKSWQRGYCESSVALAEMSEGRGGAPKDLQDAADWYGHAVRCMSQNLDFCQSHGSKCDSEMKDEQAVVERIRHLQALGYGPK